jgi:UPF0755 protein
VGKKNIYNMKKVIYLFLIIGGALLIYNSIYHVTVNDGGTAMNEDIVFEIKSGESVNSVTKRLYNEGLISSGFFYKKYLKKNNLGERIQAGTYSLNSMLSIKEIAEIFISGDTINKEKTIKIIEGWRINDIDGYLSDNNIVAKERFSNLVGEEIGNWKLQIAKPAFLASVPDNANLEGFLFPDTYRIFNDARAEDIIKKMLDNFGKKVTAEMLEDIEKQGKTLFEIITMASLIEKEVRGSEDMKMVSGIFWNRIEQNQALESCATLAYILGVQKPIYSLEDTNIKSPYNTYRNPGLPPGPICNPGLDAIMAAIYPSPNNYFYFLNRLDTGETIFSKTYDEHLKNKAKFLK